VFKTRKVKCGKGRTLRVYRNADDAFPVVAPQVAVALQGTAAVTDQLRAGVRGEASRRVEELANRIDAVSRSLRERYRAAYVVFQTDPCNQSEFLAAEVNRISRQEERLREVAISMEQVCEYARQGASDAQVTGLLKELIQTLEPSLGPVAKRVELRAKEWEEDDA
jgi:hypothetical protein